jgi:hypothetical protein
MSVEARSIEAAVGKVVASVLENRRKRGGENWVPEARKAAASA